MDPKHHEDLTAFVKWSTEMMGSYVTWGEAAAAALAEIERLKKYVQHGDGCPAWDDCPDPQPCTCGLGEG